MSTNNVYAVPANYQIDLNQKRSEEVKKHLSRALNEATSNSIHELVSITLERDGKHTPLANMSDNAILGVLYACLEARLDGHYYGCYYEHGLYDIRLCERQSVQISLKGYTDKAKQQNMFDGKHDIEHHGTAVATIMLHDALVVFNAALYIAKQEQLNND